MGFGLLLIGYFLTNILPVISVFSVAMILGISLMLVGLWRLAPYHKLFYCSYLFTFTGLPFALYYTLFSLADVGLVPSLAVLGGAVFAVVEWAYLVWGLAFHALLLLAMASLTSDLSLWGLQSAAWRNITFIVIYYLLFFVIKLPFLAKNAAPFIIPLTLLRYLCIFLNLWLFFRSWQVILPEGSDTEPSSIDRKAERREKEHEK